MYISVGPYAHYPCAGCVNGPRRRPTATNGYIVHDWSQWFNPAGLQVVWSFMTKIACATPEDHPCLGGRLELTYEGVISTIARFYLPLYRLSSWLRHLLIHISSWRFSCLHQDCYMLLNNSVRVSPLLLIVFPSLIWCAGRVLCIILYRQSNGPIEGFWIVNIFRQSSRRVPSISPHTIDSISWGGSLSVLRSWNTIAVLTYLLYREGAFIWSVYRDLHSPAVSRLCDPLENLVIQWRGVIHDLPPSAGNNFLVLTPMLIQWLHSG